MSESILEKALLEAEQLEETMKSNAKEILASTMKEEIHELVKESLNENDYLKEQEEEEVDVIDMEDDMEGEELDMEPEVSDDIELDIEDETDDVELPELPPLDLTLASDEEVLKVFKAMGDQDGIIIQKDGNEIDLTDNTTDTEYIIKLDEQKKSKKMKRVNETKEMSELDDMDNMDEMEDEVVYEIELDEDFEDSGVMGVDAPESEEGESEYDMDLGEDDEFDLGPEDVAEGGARKGDQSATRRDYMKEGGAKKGDQSATRRDYMNERGSKKGDQSATRRDYMEGGAKKGDQSATRRDYMEGGAKKGDQSATHRDYEMEEGDYGFTHHKGHSDQGYLDREDDMLGGEHGHEDDEMSLKTRGRMARGTRKFDTREASRTLGFGRDSGGKHKPSGIRKAITNNRNLGESRIRKSYNLLKEEVETLKVKNSDYKKALTTFKDKLNEVGVFNSNLAYVTRLFTEHSTTKQEKINILKRFDGVSSLKSSKELYKVIKEQLSQKSQKTISESVEKKITKSPTSGGGKLLESKVYENPQFSRMKDLMSKIK